MQTKSEAPVAPGDRNNENTLGFHLRYSPGFEWPPKPRRNWRVDRRFVVANTAAAVAAAGNFRTSQADIGNLAVAKSFAPTLDVVLARRSEVAALAAENKVTAAQMAGFHDELAKH